MQFQPNLFIVYYFISKLIYMSSNEMHFNFKSDISFYRGYTSYRSDSKKTLFLHLFEIVMFVIVIPINFTLLTYGDKMILAFALAATDSVISFFLILFQYYILFIKQAVPNYITLARDTNHTSNEQIISYQSIQDCASTTLLYSQAAVNVAGVNEQVINLYGNIARQEIQQINQYKFSQLNYLNKAYNFLSLTTMVSVIYFLATSSQLNPLQITILTIFLVLEAFLRYKIVIALLLIALSPLLCVIFLFYICCCKKGESGRNMTLDLISKEAGTDQIVKSDGECAICLMDIKIKEKVYQLKCSEKHIFHQGCLQKWTNVKASCPICRAALPMTNSGPLNNEGEIELHT